MDYFKKPSKMDHLKRHRKAAALIAVLAVLVCVYIYLDFQRYQAMEAEIGRLGQELSGLSAQQSQPTQTACTACSVLAGGGQDASPDMISGKVVRTDGDIITLSGSAMVQKENAFVPINETKEYRIAVTSATKITRNGSDIRLSDIKTGDNLIVLGKADPFRKEEMVAESISAR
jgi:hypothetical protein